MLDMLDVLDYRKSTTEQRLQHDSEQATAKRATRYC